MKTRSWMILPLLAVTFAGCADSMTAPDGMVASEGPQAAFSHTWEEGNTVRGLWAPTVETEVLGSRVELCATWTDFTQFDPEAPHVYSFDVDRLDAGGWTSLGSAGGQGSGPEACFLTEALEDGEYTFRLKGMANVPTGGTPPFSPHHTEHWEGTVEVGETFRFQAFLREAPSGWVEHASLNANAGSWNLQVMLSVWDPSVGEFLAVEDCDVFGAEDVSVHIAWAHEGEADTAGNVSACDFNGAVGAAVYDLGFTNTRQGSASEGEFVFGLEGSTNENSVTFSSAVPGGGGGGASSRGR